MSVLDYPPEFRTKDVATNGTSIYVRSGGAGPAVVLLHGYSETGDMWAPMAVDLARDHSVVVPDLRGMGLSSKPAGGFDKKTQAGDVAGILDELKIDRADLVTHDIGNMVGYAFAAQYPEGVTRFVLIDAPLPGVGPWDRLLRSAARYRQSQTRARPERFSARPGCGFSNGPQVRTDLARRVQSIPVHADDRRSTQTR